MSGGGYLWILSVSFGEVRGGDTTHTIQHDQYLILLLTCTWVHVIFSCRRKVNTVSQTDRPTSTTDRLTPLVQEPIAPLRTRNVFVIIHKRYDWVREAQRQYHVSVKSTVSISALLPSVLFMYGYAHIQWRVCIYIYVYIYIYVCTFLAKSATTPCGHTRYCTTRQRLIPMSQSRAKTNSIIDFLLCWPGWRLPDLGYRPHFAYMVMLGANRLKSFILTSTNR